MAGGGTTLLSEIQAAGLTLPELLLKTLIPTGTGWTTIALSQHGRLSRSPSRLRDVYLQCLDEEVEAEKVAAKWALGEISAEK